MWLYILCLRSTQTFVVSWQSMNFESRYPVEYMHTCITVLSICANSHGNKLTVNFSYHGKTKTRLSGLPKWKWWAGDTQLAWNWYHALDLYPGISTDISPTWMEDACSSPCAAAGHLLDWDWDNTRDVDEMKLWNRSTQAIELTSLLPSVHSSNHWPAIVAKWSSWHQIIMNECCMLVIDLVKKINILSGTIIKYTT